jgi:hypothetical protein
MTTETDDKTAAAMRAAFWLDARQLPKDAALVWYAGQEPAELRSWDLYSLDDRDYVAAFPPDYGDPGWAWEGSLFGCCSVDRVKLPNGWTLVIGYHS